MHFYYLDREQRKVTLDKTTSSKSWSAWTDSDFANSIRSASDNYDCQVTGYALDASGSRCTEGNAGCPAGREWHVEFTEYRPEGRTR